jgi:hypothetical protein
VKQSLGLDSFFLPILLSAIEFRVKKSMPEKLEICQTAWQEAESLMFEETIYGLIIYYYFFSLQFLIKWFCVLWKKRQREMLSLFTLVIVDWGLQAGIEKAYDSKIKSIKIRRDDSSASHCTLLWNFYYLAIKKGIPKQKIKLVSNLNEVILVLRIHSILMVMAQWSIDISRTETHIECLQIRSVARRRRQRKRKRRQESFWDPFSMSNQLKIRTWTAYKRQIFHRFLWLLSLKRAKKIGKILKFIRCDSASLHFYYFIAGTSRQCRAERNAGPIKRHLWRSLDVCGCHSVA